jgi:hypothetical protein
MLKANSKINWLLFSRASQQFVDPWFGCATRVDMKPATTFCDDYGNCLNNPNKAIMSQKDPIDLFFSSFLALKINKNK